jgi:hypothetical protein
MTLQEREMPSSWRDGANLFHNNTPTIMTQIGKSVGMMVCGPKCAEAGAEIGAAADRLGAEKLKQMTGEKDKPAAVAKVVADTLERKKGSEVAKNKRKKKTKRSMKSAVMAGRRDWEKKSGSKNYATTVKKKRRRTA